MRLTASYCRRGRSEMQPTPTCKYTQPALIAVIPCRRPPVTSLKTPLLSVPTCNCHPKEHLMRDSLCLFDGQTRLLSYSQATVLGRELSRCTHFALQTTYIASVARNRRWREDDKKMAPFKAKSVATHRTRRPPCNAMPFLP